MQTGLLRVFLWNIESGGGSRLGRIAKSITEQSPAPDVIVLNEYRIGKSDQLIADLKAAGWTEFLHSNPPEGFGGVAILSREKLKPGTEPIGLGDQAYRCITVELESAALTLWSVYAPFKEGCKEFWEPMLDTLRANIGRDAVLIGDLNAGTDSDVPAQSRLAGTPFVHQILDAGYNDIWMSCAGGSRPMEHTWCGEVNPYRIDHVFGTPSANSRVRSCSYDHACRERNDSDHSALTVAFTPKPLARAGSQRWLQVAVNSHPHVLNEQILGALVDSSAEDKIEWLSPLEDERYIEYRDGATIDRLNLSIDRVALKDFWPAGGPVWDGLARVGKSVLLIEAKAHIPEMLSPGTRATGEARTKILDSLKQVRDDLVPRSEVEWDGAFYQYANRIAHLHFLRKQNVDAHLVYVYFLNAPDVDSPTTREVWEGATTLMESVLGIRRTRLSPYIHKVFIDVRELDSNNGANTK